MQKPRPHASRTAAPDAPASERRPRVSLWAALACMAGALLVLRRVGSGLPAFLDEAIPFRQAIKMWGTPPGPADLNPHLFHYPSLVIYLEFALQHLVQAARALAGAPANAADLLLGYATDPSTLVVPARVLSVIAFIVTILLAARIAERLRAGSGALAAWLVALSLALAATTLGIHTDTFMALFALAAIDAMVAFERSDRDGALWRSALFIGLATGAKYPAALLYVPLAALLVARRGTRSLPGLGGAALAIVGVFLATTPYALLDARTFLQDVSFVRTMAGEGQLGNLETPGASYYAGMLWQELGWFGVVLLVSALASLLLRRAGRVALGLVAAALLMFALPIALSHIAADRYLAPVLPIAMVLVATEAWRWRDALPPRYRSIGAAVLLAVLVLPPAWAAARSASRAARSTPIEAARWCEAHLPADAWIVSEEYGPALLADRDKLRVTSGSLFAHASATARAAYRARTARRVIHLPLSVVGRCQVELQFQSGPPAVLDFFPHAVDLNQVFYDPRLFRGVDYLVTSAGVRGRFITDPARFRAECDLYALLDSTADLARRFRPDRDTQGPEITLYRLGPRFQRALAAMPPLDPLWWADCTPASFRLEAERMLLPRRQRTGGALRDSSGAPTAWVRLLAEPYATRIRTFTEPMAEEALRQGDATPAMTLTEAAVELVPDDVAARGTYERAKRALADRTARARLSPR